MFKKLNSALPLSALSLLMIANAQGFALESSRIDALEARVAQLSQDNTQYTVSGKNPTTRTTGYNSGAFLVSDFLYWQAVQDGIEYALKSKAPLGSTAFLGSGQAEITSGKMKSIDFDWGPGFRIGLGYNFRYDQWDLFLNWTRFHNHTTSSSRAPSGGSLAALWIPITVGGGDTRHAHARWHLMYDVVDLELGRSFYLTKALSARPFVGLRGAFIRQHMKFEYEDVHLINSPNLFDMNTRAKNDYFSGGLRAGTKMNFRVSNHWSFYGAAAASLLYGDFDVKLHFQFPGQSISPLKLGYKANYHRTQANVEGSIGLQWETGYADGRYHITILACYEFTEWFNQNQLLKVLAPGLFNPAFLPNDGDLGMQGGTLSVRFDF
ncbi:MAG: hypothetical protein JSR39_06490 [Verrucomicrobia bacterium]|nr:hypothetical protein [Verrucomicrobiota bacterium]